MVVLSAFRRFATTTITRTMAPLSITLNDGKQIPWLGFGTGTALYGKDAASFVQVAISNGVTHLDGAQIYGNEDTLGAGIAASGKSRSELFVTTKLAKVPEGQTVRDTLIESLKKLRLDYVDLFLIHMPTHHEGKLKSVWKQFEEIQKEGLAKSIGVSNFRVKDLEQVLESATVIPAVNQIEFHPYVYKAALPVLALQKKHNIVTESYGGLTPIVRNKGGPVDPVLATIRARLEKDTGKNVTEGQVLGLWLRAQGVVEVTTSTKEERVKEYVSTQSLPDITPEEVEAISEAGSKLHHRAFCQFFDE
ncbi:Aldo/keto reductase [Trametes versicolor FP-101664 SS1]|uniref:Aldo/keto reductase n=1 Tax=Trametes versicolor (strain FP-101664) TaxID=717944 RepID=UPI00046223DF|nr:Aldo/keto reductase [Trametes versicolor FP-101664 SS1]EIW60362.1 Aldo/keto reductase [Trametes versicolor FP-101664 SS1]